MGLAVSLLLANRKLADCRRLYAATLDMWNQEKINFQEQMGKISESLLSFDDLPLKHRQEFRMKAGDALAENKCVRIICEKLSEALKQDRDDHKMIQSFVKQVIAGEKKETSSKSVFELALQTIVLVTEPDCSAEACKEVLIHQTFLRKLVAEMVRLKEETSNPIFREGVAIMHNMSVYQAECTDGYEQPTKTAAAFSNVFLENLDEMKEVLESCAHKDHSLKLLGVTASACLDTIEIKQTDIQFMCLNLSMAFDESDHRNHRCTVTAMERGIRHQLTKKTREEEPEERHPRTYLVQCGVARLLMKGAQSEIHQEKMACLESLRTVLYFVERCRKEIADDKPFVKLLAKHYKPLPRTPCEELAKLMLEKLHITYGLHLTKKLEKQVAENPDEHKSAQTTNGTVMLSYQWANKEIVQKINSHLKENSIDTWIDEEKMFEQADVNDSMAAAVEKCSVFLMGVSSTYAESKNCKKEASYAETRDKTIIPLQLEKGYDPKGWLGIMRSSKFYFEITKETPKDDLIKKLDELVWRIRKILNIETPQKDKTSIQDGGLQQKPKVPFSTKKVTKRTASVAPYCRLHPNASCVSRSDGFLHCCCQHTDPKKELKEWATKFKMNGQEVRSLTKNDLETLIDLRDKAPDFFYRRIWDDLKMKKLSDVTRFERALSYWEKEERMREEYLAGKRDCKQNHKEAQKDQQTEAKKSEQSESIKDK